MWTKHIKDPKKKIEYEKALRASTLALGRLLDILEEEDRSLSRQEVQVSDFDSPSWPYKQAFYQGQKSQIRKLITNLEFIKGNPE